jgi:hypothetical protein
MKASRRISRRVQHDRASRSACQRRGLRWPSTAFQSARGLAQSKTLARKPGPCGLAWLCLLLITAMPLAAATNSDQLDEILVLSSPHPELPPTFWEQYGAWIVLAAVLVVGLAAVVGWLLLRAKPPVVLPVEVQARQELEALRQRGEDGKTLSQVSRVLRRYVAAAFRLPPEELTTAEFCRALADQERTGADLAAAVGEFLRRCDELKFAPSFAPVRSVGVQASACPDLPLFPQDTLKRELQPGATRALELVELGEARRAQLRQMATAPAAGQPAQGA